MRKVLLYCLLLFSLFFVQTIFAHEGRFSLRGTNFGCEGISVWRTSYYISGRCAGLVYPYREQLTRYALWAQTDEQNSQVVFVDDINNGIIDGRIARSFTRLFVTPEQESILRQPIGPEIASGTVETFTFEASVPVVIPTIAMLITPTPTPANIPIPSSNNIPWGIIIIAVVVILFIVVGIFSFARRG